MYLTMAYRVDFDHVSAVGLESSPVAQALAGLRANEARYFKNKYNHTFTTLPAHESQETLNYIHRILKEERDILIESKPLETASMHLETERWGKVKWVYVFYESGLSINIVYAEDDPSGRAVGFKLSEGMEVPQELANKFKFAHQKSKLAGVIRGSYFIIKGQY